MDFRINSLLVNDGVRFKQSCVLYFADTEIGFATKLATEVCEECRLRMLARNHVPPTFINGFLKKSAILTPSNSRGLGVRLV